jgi:hypothetical protein
MFEELMTLDESLIAWELSDMFIIPPSIERKKVCKNAKRAKKGTYSSANQSVIPLEEVRNLVLNQGLI